MSFEKLEDEFDLEKNEELDELMEKYHEALNLSDKIKESLETDEHAEFMDQYAEDAKKVYDEIVGFANAVEPRFASELYQAAASLLKLAIDAKNSKKDFALKDAELVLKRRKMDLEERKLDIKIDEVNNKNKLPTETKFTLDKDAILKAVNQFGRNTNETKK